MGNHFFTGICHLCLLPATEPGGKPPAGFGTSEALLAPSQAPTEAQSWVSLPSLSRGEWMGCQGRAALAGPWGLPSGPGAVGSVRQRAQQRKGCALRQPRPAPLRYLRDSLPSPLPLALAKAGSRKHMGLGPLTLTPPCPLLPRAAGLPGWGFSLTPSLPPHQRCSSTAMAAGAGRLFYSAHPQAALHQIPAC